MDSGLYSNANLARAIPPKAEKGRRLHAFDSLYASIQGNSGISITDPMVMGLFTIDGISMNEDIYGK